MTDLVKLNPFLKDIKKTIKLRTRKRGNLHGTLSINGGSEIIFEPAIHKEEEYESIEFTQVLGGLSYLKILTTSELAIFFYVFDNLIRYNSDEIYFNHTAIREKLGLTNRGHTYGFIKKMIAANILQLKEDDTYWLNPYKIYKGKRTYLKYW